MMVKPHFSGSPSGVWADSSMGVEIIEDISKKTVLNEYPSKIPEPSQTPPPCYRPWPRQARKNHRYDAVSNILLQNERFFHLIPAAKLAVRPGPVLKLLAHASPAPLHISGHPKTMLPENDYHNWCEHRYSKNDDLSFQAWCFP